MRNLLVFLDGTRNRSEGTRLTNVAKLFMLAPSSSPDGNPQIKFYSPGVGVYRALDKVWTVLTGVGVQISLRLAYQFIAANFEPGSRIFIFGFSPGAFSARHLAGLIARVGILDSGDLGLTRDAWDRYRYDITDRRPLPTLPTTQPSAVQFLGLWDTVASTRPFVMGRNNGMYGGRLEAQILNVRHALARDERRFGFYPQTYEGHMGQYQEKWFPGYHCDVGGGYVGEKSRLSNAALLWMMQEARLCGLSLPVGFPLECALEGRGTPHEYLWTPFLNRPRHALYTRVYTSAVEG